MIEIYNKGNSKETHYNVVNYCLYQSKNDDESNAKVTESKQSLDTNKKDKKDKNINNIYKVIFEHWNSKKIVVHRSLTDKIKRKINSALKNYTVEEIKKAIDNYDTVLKGEQYYWTYKWTLEEFLQRGFERFYTDACFENFKKDKQQPQRGGYKPANASNYEQRKYSDADFENLYKEV